MKKWWLKEHRALWLAADVALIVWALSFGFARAASITVTLTDDEQNVAVQALDALVRANGIQAAPKAVDLLRRLQAAFAQSQTKDKPNEAPPSPPAGK